MTGKEDIKVGDKLICVHNEGLMHAGWEHTVKGITENDINVYGCPTCWQGRDNFRWDCYRHETLTPNN